MLQQVFSFLKILINNNQQPNSKDIKNKNEKCREDGGPNDGENRNFCHLLWLQHESLSDDVSFPHPQWLLNSTPSHTVTVTFFGAQ